PASDSQRASAASDPAPSPSALTCVVSTMLLASCILSSTRRAAARRIGSIPLPVIVLRSVARDPLVHLGPGRCQMDGVARRCAVYDAAAQCGQERTGAMAEGRHVDPCAADLPHRVRVRPRTERQTPRARPRDRTLVQGRAVYARIETLHDVDEILDRAQNA